MASIREKGTIAILGEVQTGTSQSGNTWARQTIVVDIEGYNGNFRKVALQASGNIVTDLEQMMVGDKVEITYQVTAREWQGKWYNNVDLFKIELLEESVQQPVAPAMPPQPQPTPAAPQQRVARPRRTTPLVPPNANIDPQDGDLPW